MSRPTPPVRLVARNTQQDRIERVGLSHRHFSDLYHHLLAGRWWRIAATVLAFYLGSNVLFALLYLIGGNNIENARPGSFEDAFFFSVQTMATIGYGRFSPVTLWGHVLVTVEALCGLVGLALVTGLVFAKFSRPTARVMFSRVAVVAPWDGRLSLLFRMANERANQIVEAQLRLVLARSEVTREGIPLRRFYDLVLQRQRTAIFALTWTAIHPIDEHSPLFGQTPESLAAAEAELIASLTGIDETFSQTVHARWSYIASDLRWGARFVDILSRSPDGRRRVDYTRFHEVVPIEAPAPTGTD
jgi:inward rectifier potassium channel